MFLLVVPHETDMEEQGRPRVCVYPFGVISTETPKDWDFLRAGRPENTRQPSKTGFTRVADAERFLFQEGVV